MATIQEMKELALHAVRGTAPANFAKEDVHGALREAMNGIAGDLNEFMAHRYEIYSIIIEAAEEYVPQRVIQELSMFADVLNVPQGQTVEFKRKLGRNRAKSFLTQVGLSGVYETFRLDADKVSMKAHAVGGAARIDFERFLDGYETMTDLMEIINEGLVEAVYCEVQKALQAAYSQSNARNRACTNGFDADAMRRLIGTVKAYGAGAVIFATPQFVEAMGPDAIVKPLDNAQGIYHPDDINDIHTKGRISIFRGTPIVEIPQSFLDENNDAWVIDPHFAYILPTGGEKVIKVIFEGKTQIYDWTNKDQSMEIHTYKKMGVAIMSYNNWAIYVNCSLDPDNELPTKSYMNGDFLAEALKLTVTDGEGKGTQKTVGGIEGKTEEVDLKDGGLLDYTI